MFVLSILLQKQTKLIVLFPARPQVMIEQHLVN